MSGAGEVGAMVGQGIQGLQGLINSKNVIETANAMAQIAAWASSVQLTPSTAYIAGGANAIAAMMVAEKMAFDYYDGKGIKAEDVLALAGNLITTAAAVGLMFTPAGRAISILAKIGAILGGLQLANAFIPKGQAAQITDLLRDTSTYRIVYYDPLVLDLNSNGIETVSSNGMSGALFDLNNDGIRTATGWIGSNDGILVRDVNGNGSIDNGAEVFGDSTNVANGLTANNGFTALANLDSNGDGVVDAADANFAQLQVWRDLNQNGVSDAGELFTLQSLSIQSLNTAITSTPNAALAGGIQAQTGSFTRSDGSTSTMADINLTQDTWHSRYIDQIAVPAALQHLPNISGMGRLIKSQKAGNDGVFEMRVMR